MALHFGQHLREHLQIGAFVLHRKRKVAENIVLLRRHARWDEYLVLRTNELAHAGACLRCAKERQNRQAELLGKMRVPALHYSVLRRRARKICDIEDSFRKILSIIANFAQTMIFLAKFYAETSILDNVQQQLLWQRDSDTLSGKVARTQ